MLHLLVLSSKQPSLYYISENHSFVELFDLDEVYHRPTSPCHFLCQAVSALCAPPHCGTGTDAAKTAARLCIVALLSPALKQREGLMRQDGWKDGAEDGRGMMISCDFWYFFFGKSGKIGSHRIWN